MRALVAAGMVSLLAVGCSGSTGPPGQPGPKGDTGNPGAAVIVARVDPGAACASGGTSISSGAVTAYACNGTRGDQGPQGDPGMAGTSVSVAALGLGSACAYGGAQISDGATTALACTGAPGVKGEQGLSGAKGDKGDKGDQGPAGTPPPRLIVRTATGQLLGPVIGLAGDPQFPWVYVETLSAATLLDVVDGRIRVGCALYYESGDCSGQGYLGSPSPFTVCGAGDNQLWIRISNAQPVRTYRSTDDGTGCSPWGPQTATTYLGQRVFDSRYPYAGPLTYSYE